MERFRDPGRGFRIVALRRAFLPALLASLLAALPGLPPHASGAAPGNGSAPLPGVGRITPGVSGAGEHPDTRIAADAGGGKKGTRTRKAPVPAGEAARPAQPAKPGRTLKVLATFLPTWVFAKNVIGETPGVSLDILLPASLGCPHDYALTPGDMRKLSSADLLVANGLGMEEFLGLPVQKANARIRVVETAAGLPVLPYSAGTEERREGEGNPHVWVSVRNAVAQVRSVEKALASASPSNAPVFKANADAYARRLFALSREMETASARFSRRRIVTTHSTFAYLARDLGLEVVGVLSAEPGREPSAGEVARLVSEMRAKGAAAVFSEPQYPARMAETVAREAGVPLRSLDPAATGPLSASAYEDAMRKNLAVLSEVLGR